MMFEKHVSPGDEEVFHKFLYDFDTKRKLGKFAQAMYDRFSQGASTAKDTLRDTLSKGADIFSKGADTARNIFPQGIKKAQSAASQFGEGFLKGRVGSSDENCQAIPETAEKASGSGVGKFSEAMSRANDYLTNNLHNDISDLARSAWVKLGQLKHGFSSGMAGPDTMLRDSMVCRLQNEQREFQNVDQHVSTMNEFEICLRV
jgi:hypothetical protein